MSFLINGTTMDGLLVDNSKMEKLYINGIMVWEDMKKLTTSGLTNIREYIDKHAPGKKKVEITITGINPGIVSGDLTGLDVTLIVNGEVQGKRTSSDGGDAINLTSPIKLINNGWIRGAGGRGGTGGKGKNDKYEVEKTKDYYSKPGCTGTSGFSGVYHVAVVPNGYGVGKPLHIFFWNKDRVNTKGSNTTTMPGVSGKLKRGKYRQKVNCSGHVISLYEIEHITETSKTRTGGDGGAGGYGQGYHKAKTSGKPGESSSPKGGYSGGKGGTGGSWGKDGSTGKSSGKKGDDAGNAIKGKRFLSTGSTTGSVSGTIV